MNDEAEAACKGWDDVFLSLDPNDHHYAANICKTKCPKRDWCQRQLETALADPSYGLGVHGTWNGQLFKGGRRITRKRGLRT